MQGQGERGCLTLLFGLRRALRAVHRGATGARGGEAQRRRSVWAGPGGSVDVARRVAEGSYRRVSGLHLGPAGRLVVAARTAWRARWQVPLFAWRTLADHYLRHCDVRGLVWMDPETMGCAVHLIVVDYQGRAAESESPARLRAGSTQPAQRQAASKSRGVRLAARRMAILGVTIPRGWPRRTLRPSLRLMDNVDYPRNIMIN